MSQAALSLFLMSGEDMDADLRAVVCDALDACSDPEPTAEVQVACTLVLAHYHLLETLVGRHSRSGRRSHRWP